MWELTEAEGNRAVLRSDAGSMLIEACTPSAVHVVYTGQDHFSQRKSKTVIRKDAKTVLSVSESEGVIRFRTEKILLAADKVTGAFRWYDAEGNLLVREPEKGGKFLTEKDVYLPEYDESVVIKEIESADGIKSTISAGNYKFSRKAYEAKLAFEFGDEAIYGLGQHEEGIFNYRGHSQYLYQQNMKLAIPMIVSTNHYAVMLDCMSYAAFHDNALESYFWCDCEDELDYYFLTGQNFDELIGQYRYLTGDVPLFPKWAYGFVQSKEHYSNQQELLSVVEEYRKRGIPLDCIVQDWQYWQGDKWGNKILDETRYPDFKGTVSKIHDMNCKVMISIWPNMMRGGENQQELLQAGGMLADRMVYNAYDEKAGDLYWAQAKRGLFDCGIDAWWCDSTEPYYADWSGAVEPELTERARLCVDEFKKFIDPEKINGYSLYHSDNIYRNQRKCSEKRVVNLTRSYFPGQQRMGTIVWSGDISARWKVFKNQIPAALNVTVTGMPNWTYDIGAFFSSDRAQWFWSGDYDRGVQDPAYREFFLRMFQTAVFLPMMRAHGTDTPREIWQFGEKGELFYDSLVSAVKERYALLPHIYSLAAEQTLAGFTALRSLAFDYGEDKNVWDVSDEFMMGHEFLVCPIFESMFDAKMCKKERKTRSVYFPEGRDWYTYTGKKLYKGGRRRKVPVKMEEIPVFVASGSIVLKQAEVTHTGQKPAWYEIHVYGGRDASFRWYEDAGDGYGYEAGEYAFINIEWKQSERVLTIGKAEGGYVPEPGRQIRIFLYDVEKTAVKNLVYGNEAVRISL